MLYIYYWKSSFLLVFSLILNAALCSQFRRDNDLSRIVAATVHNASPEEEGDVACAVYLIDEPAVHVTKYEPVLKTGLFVAQILTYACRITPNDGPIYSCLYNDNPCGPSPSHLLFAYRDGIPKFEDTLFGLGTDDGWQYLVSKVVYSRKLAADEGADSSGVRLTFNQPTSYSLVKDVEDIRHDEQVRGDEDEPEFRREAGDDRNKVARVRLNGNDATANSTQPPTSSPSGAELNEAALLNLLQNDATVQKALYQIVYDKFLKPFRDNANAFYLVSMAIQIHIMQCGFALLETGCIRAKNATNSMWKNCVCGFVAAIGFYLTGFGIAFGTDAGGFIGTSYFAFDGMRASTEPDTPNNPSFWFFEYAFCTTASTIISGAIAERAHVAVFLTSSLTMSAFTYPFIAHWVWNSGGWLKMGTLLDETTGKRIGFQDFAGSGAVHMAGGAASLAAIMVLGARYRRFPRDGGAKFEPIGHSVTLVGLGCMILSTEFVAFNAGSEERIDHRGDAPSIGLSATNTMLAGAGGFLSVALYDFWTTYTFPLVPAFCGSLAGSVAICAGCNVVEPWAAFIIGFIAGIVYLLVSKLMVILHLDDPVDAVAVHLGGGFTGLFTLAFLNPVHGVFYRWSMESGYFLGWQLAGAVSIFVWSFTQTMLICILLNCTNYLKVSISDEEYGLDIAHGHEIAYPREAYVDENSTTGMTQTYIPGDSTYNQEKNSSSFR